MFDVCLDCYGEKGPTLEKRLKIFSPGADIKGFDSHW